jgi:hypothetical protein
MKCSAYVDSASNHCTSVPCRPMTANRDGRSGKYRGRWMSSLSSDGSQNSGKSLRMLWFSVNAMSCGSRGPGSGTGVQCTSSPAALTTP